MALLLEKRLTRKKEARIITGIESKTANFRASTREKPKNKPAAKVIPERETPGISAILCASPIKNASLYDNSLIFFAPRF